MKTQFNDGEFHVCAELKERRYNEVGDVRPVKWHTVRYECTNLTDQLRNKTAFKLSCSLWCWKVNTTTSSYPANPTLREIRWRNP